MEVVKKINNHLKYFIIYLISFVINYLFFINFVHFIDISNAFMLNIINLFAWIISMLFIFYVDKKYVPDLVDENNSSELSKFILIRIFSLIAESIILFIFITLLRYDFYMVKLISLVLLFILNEFYIRHIKFS